jgi:hypothetical protein
MVLGKHRIRVIRIGSYASVSRLSDLQIWRSGRTSESGNVEFVSALPSICKNLLMNKPWKSIVLWIHNYFCWIRILGFVILNYVSGSYLDIFVVIDKKYFFRLVVNN